MAGYKQTTSIQLVLEFTRLALAFKSIEIKRYELLHIIGENETGEHGTLVGARKATARQNRLMSGSAKKLNERSLIRIITYFFDGKEEFYDRLLEGDLKPSEVKLEKLIQIIKDDIDRERKQLNEIIK